MVNIKYWVIAPILLLFFVCLGPIEAEASCDKSSPGVIDFTAGAGAGRTPVGESGTASDQCSDIPDEYLVTFNKIGICKEDPLSGAALFGTPNFTTCEFIYDGPDNDVIIRHPNFSSLSVPAFSIPAGTYNFLAAVISNKLGMKNTVTFDDNVSGTTGTGTTCWTSGGTSSSFNEAVTTPHGTTLAGNVSQITCGTAAAAAPVFNFEVIPFFNGDDCASDFNGNADFDNGGFSENVFDGSGVITARVTTGNLGFATDCASASKMVWIVAAETPYVVSPSSTFTLEFKLTDSVSVDFDSGSDQIMKMGNDPIQAILTVID